MQENAPNDTRGEIDFSSSIILERLDSWVDGATRAAPNIVGAIVVVVIAYFIASLIQRLVRSRLASRDREDLGRMLGGLIKWTIVILAFLLGATVVFPSLSPGDLIAGLGVSSVAIGFAFKDILQNWLAGLLILLRQPFEIGDQIEVSGYVGSVERIQTRSTLIKTFDGQRAVIPNSDVYTDAVLVKTAHDIRRSQYDIGIGYGDSIGDAIGVLKDALMDIEGIEKDPAPEALPWDLAASWATIRLRWWTDSKRADVVRVRSQVIEKIKTALDEAKIDMPYETQVHLFHDQTEEHDGVPGKQREGWPERADMETRSRRQVENEENSGRDSD